MTSLQRFTNVNSGAQLPWQHCKTGMMAMITAECAFDQVAAAPTRVWLASAALTAAARAGRELRTRMGKAPPMPPAPATQKP